MVNAAGKSFTQMINAVDKKAVAKEAVKVGSITPGLSLPGLTQVAPGNGVFDVGPKLEPWKIFY